jgi:hypothetical protein
MVLTQRPSSLRLKTGYTIWQKIKWERAFLLFPQTETYVHVSRWNREVPRKLLIYNAEKSVNFFFLSFFIFFMHHFISRVHGRLARDRRGRLSESRISFIVIWVDFFDLRYIIVIFVWLFGCILCIILYPNCKHMLSATINLLILLCFLKDL